MNEARDGANIIDDASLQSLDEEHKNRVLTALNEEVPITNLSLGKFNANQYDFSSLRKQYDCMVTMTNSFSPPLPYTGKGDLKCDCCLSSVSIPMQQN